MGKLFSLVTVDKQIEYTSSLCIPAYQLKGYHSVKFTHTNLIQSSKPHMWLTFYLVMVKYNVATCVAHSGLITFAIIAIFFSARSYHFEV